MKIIQLGHRKRQGKDTVATMLQERLPNAEVMAFARPMKDIFYGAMGLTFEEGEEKKNTDHEFRQCLQRFGSGDIKTYFSPSVWRDVLMANTPECDYLIIPDFRFYEEYIPQSLTIRVHRDEDYSDQHSSETALEDFPFDILLINDGSMEQLSDRVDTIIREMM